jgi:glycosyltransferase involved in cell wall biosynthesis
MRRIAIVTPILPVPHDPTRGRYIHETARALGRIATVRTYFAQPRYPRMAGLAPRSFLGGNVGADYALDGIDVEAFTYPTLPGVSRLSNGFVAARALTPRMRRFEPDLVLAYWVYPDGFAALRSARRLGVPCIVGARGSDIHVRSGFNAFMTRHTIAQADALLTVSTAMRDAAIARYGAKPDYSHTIINGFSTAVFHPRAQADVREKLGIAADLRVIVYVGRLVEAKGMRELIDAFAALAARDPQLRLAIVGDGVMREALTALIHSRNLGGFVLMPGAFEPDGVAEWICASDVLTLPSWSEGYPNVVVEAIACGVPVVATDVGGTREIIVDGDNGILIPPRDAKALEHALADALTRPWDHLAIAAAMARSWGDVAAETLAVCERVIAAHDRR